MNQAFRLLSGLWGLGFRICEGTRNQAFGALPLRDSGEGPRRGLEFQHREPSARTGVEGTCEGVLLT